MRLVADLRRLVSELRRFALSCDSDERLDSLCPRRHAVDPNICVDDRFRDLLAGRGLRRIGILPVFLFVLPVSLASSSYGAGR